MIKFFRSYLVFFFTVSIPHIPATLNSNYLLHLLSLNTLHVPAALNSNCALLVLIKCTDIVRTKFKLRL